MCLKAHERTSAVWDGRAEAGSGLISRKVQEKERDGKSSGLMDNSLISELSRNPDIVQHWEHLL